MTAIRTRLATPADAAALANEDGLIADVHALWRGGDFPATMDRWSL